jgi:hypothetical protein
MNSQKLIISLKFADAWRATPDEIGVLLDKMTESLIGSGVDGLSFSGDLEVGDLIVAFDWDTSRDEDSFEGFKLVVKALNAGQVLAPGWPDDQVVADAIASVKLAGMGVLAAV